jgi:hypothetical protein
LLVPLADGSLLRLALPLEETTAAVDGPDWRPSRSPVDLQAHVVGLRGHDFLTTDGGRGLTRWRWPPDGTWRALPENKDPASPTLVLPARIVSAPVVLPPTDPKADEQHVCLADAEGNLHLLRARGDRLERQRMWPMGGKITEGPFVRKDRIGCVVDRRRLVWIDPARSEPLWEYRSQGEAIVGQPQLARDDLLVVADQSGRFVGLNPEDGKAHGEGYQLKARVAPAAAPTAYGSNRLFAPLTDGTVMLLSLHRLRELRDPLQGFPLFW